MNSYSQCGEDKWILENLKPPIGTFCEVGAFDGVQSSNTLMFEELGWDGMLVEADPFLSAKSQGNRKCYSLCCAAGYSGIRPFHINVKDRGLSGFTVSGTMTIMCPTFTLREIIYSVHWKCVDLLSIDTEGAELEVWESIGELRPQIVIMEHQTCDRPSNIEPILERMTKDGYREVHRTQYNLIFTR